MNQTSMDNMIKSTLNTLNALKMTYAAFLNIEKVVKKTGRKEIDVAEIILEKYLSNWDEDLATLLKSVSGEYKSASKYSVLYDMSAGFIKEPRNLVYTTKELNKYTFILGCKYSISYLISCVDMITGIFYRGKMLQERNNIPQDSIDRFEEAIDLDKEVVNSLKLHGIDDNKLISLYNSYKDFIMLDTNAYSDTEVYQEFLGMFSDSIVNYVRENSMFISPLDLSSAIAKAESTTGEQDVIEYFEGIVSDKANKISMLDDIQRDFTKSVGGPGSKYYKNDISKVPIEITCEVIFKGRVTDSYLEFLDFEKDELSLTQEFKDE